MIPTDQQDAIEELETVEDLSAYIQSSYDGAIETREQNLIESRLQKCADQYAGEYEARVKQAIEATNGIEVFRKITTTKCKALQDWLYDILFSTPQKIWTIKHTPVPDLKDELVKAITEKVKAIVSNKMEEDELTKEEAGELGYKEAFEMRKKVEAELNSVAKKKASMMELVMSDQTVEGKWENAIKEFIINFSIFPNAFIRGPVIKIKKTKEWVKKKGKTVMQVSDKPSLEWHNVSPFDVFPSNDAKTVQDGTLHIRTKITRNELARFRKENGYNEENINSILEKKMYPSIDRVDEDTEHGRRNFESENLTDDFHRDVFEAFEFFGPVAGWLLSEWGMDVEDELMSYEIHAIKCEGELIRVVLNPDPMDRRPFYSASFDVVPNSFWGSSIPEAMRDIQSICNFAIRSLCKNLSLSSGPQVVIDLAQISDSTNIKDIIPNKIWFFDGENSMNTRKALEFVNIPINSQEMLSVYQQTRNESDNVTNIPAFQTGDTDVSGAGKALANYEKILTPSGSVEIGNIKVGDKVLNTYGSNSNVLAVYPQGKRDIYRVKFSNKEVVDCDIEHRWSVSTHPERGFKTLTLKEILKNGLYRETKINDRCPSGIRSKWAIPNIECVNYDEKAVEIDPYTMGALIGDGDARCRLTSEDEEIFDRIPYELGKIDNSESKGNSYARTILGLKSKYHKYGLNCKSIYKFIPDDYLFNSKEIRLELLRGLMDTDGCCSERGDMIFLSTSSERLRDDFVRLVKSLGAVSVSIKEEKDGKGSCRGREFYRKENYKVRFYLADERIFHLDRKQDRVRKRKVKHVYITEVEPISKKSLATCITVDSKDSLFLCDNYIPTHNTARGLSILQGNSLKGIKSIILNISKNIIQPSIEFLYDWNMIYNEDESIKGDMNVVPKGPLEVVTKEEKSVRVNELLAITNNPTDLQITGLAGRAKLYRESVKVLDMDVDDIIRTDEQLEQEEESNRQAQQAQAQAEQQAQQAQLQLENKKIDADVQNNTANVKAKIGDSIRRTASASRQKSQVQTSDNKSKK